jgi:hypothetical protein
MLSFDVIIFHGQQMLSFLCYFPLNIFCVVEAGCFASAQIVVPNSQQISCLDGSFLECSLPMQEARVRSPAGTCQSQDL